MCSWTHVCVKYAMKHDPGPLGRMSHQVLMQRSYPVGCAPEDLFLKIQRVTVIHARVTTLTTCFCGKWMPSGMGRNFLSMIIDVTN